MARRVYFAFHYDDVFRCNVVRNSWLTHRDRGAAGFFDASLWEKAKKESPAALKRLINDGLHNTSVTVFLLGSHTADRPWVNYELIRSVQVGNGLVGVRINNIAQSTNLLGSRVSLPTAPGPDIPRPVPTQREPGVRGPAALLPLLDLRLGPVGGVPELRPLG